MESQTVLLDLDGTLGELFTPVTAAQRVLAAAPGCRVLVLADEPVRDELARHGRLVSLDEARSASHVVIGDCRQTLSYRHLDAAFRAVRAGAELMALQRGRYYRAADGDHVDTGAIVAAVEYAAERPARVLGKPSRDFLRLADQSAGGAAAGRLWVVGDDRTTDIEMANAADAISVQVRTGKYADQRDNDALARAAHVIDSVADLPELISRRLS